MGCRVSKTAEVGAEEAAIEVESGGNANVNNTASNNKQAAQPQSSGTVCVPGTVENALASSQTFSPNVLDIVHQAGLDDILRDAPKGTSAETLSSVGDTIKAAVSSAMPWIVGAVEVVGPAVPFFAPVFSLLTKAYGCVCAMKDVNEQVQVLRASLEGLAQAVFRAMASYKQATDTMLLSAQEEAL